MMTSFAKLAMIFSVLLVVACSSSQHAPVIELKQPPNDFEKYIVQKGDTLFSIAWRYDLDYKAVAAYNHIEPPYLIKPGQTITLSEAPADQQANTKSDENLTKYRSPAPKVEKNQKKSGVVTQKRVENTYELQAFNDKGWLWPINNKQGQLVKSFSLSGSVNKGIDIKASAGTPVLATRSGKVVYADSGLKGYGKLVIIKHDEIYLSAYAHNRKILVKEGQVVKQGQIIAELGKSGTDTYKLHFEIRKNGKPVNPVQFVKQ